MKKDYTDITILLDRSGSMQMIKTDVEGGLHTFAKEQAELPGICLLTVYQFDSVSFDETTKTQQIKKDMRFTIEPRGMTPLLDSIAKAISATGDRLRMLVEEDRPEHVVFVIATDGQENASVEMTREHIKAMIAHQADTYNWQFVYVGANQDAFAEAATLGIRDGATITYAANSIGTQAMYSSVSASVARVRSGDAHAVEFTQDDYKKQAEAGMKGDN